MMREWRDLIGKERQKPYFQQILERVSEERAAGKKIYPPRKAVFNAFSLTPLDQLSVVILGQDPYHGAGQAHGLAFSVERGITPPPSLRNIYKELAEDIEGFQIPAHGNLTTWAQQGVLLLNTVLTVEEGRAHSHAKIGWETFTDAVIAAINAHCNNIVFILWGAHAQRKGQGIDQERHYVLRSAHPSPLAAYRGFFGSRPFSKTNQYLQAEGKPPIDWHLPD